MFFHIDESGNSGNNLFDLQKRLSYGVLSSRLNADALGKELHGIATRRLQVPQLHANELGERRLEDIADLLLAMHAKLDFSFGYYFIDKEAYAVTQLFEAVFDAGLNEAVPWLWYWTPARFALLLHLHSMVDEGILRKAWALCTDRRISNKYEEVVLLLQELKARSGTIRDPRIREIMSDAFSFGIARPQDLDFGAPDPRLVSPNVVAFQFVVAEIGRQIRKKGAKTAVAITLDYQQQFNSSQVRTHQTQRLIANGIKHAEKSEREFYFNHPLFSHRSRHEILLEGLPSADPVAKRSSNSIGLQIVDVYLWVANRVASDMPLPPKLFHLAQKIFRRASFDGVSMQGFEERWRAYEKQLPRYAELSAEQLRRARAHVDDHRARLLARQS